MTKSSTAPLVSIPVPYTVAEATDALQQELVRRSVDIFASIDHAEAARKVGLTLRETRVLLFGNPQVGTLLMQQNAEISLILPLKVLVYAGDEGTQIQYQTLRHQAPDFGLDPEAPIVQKLDGFMASLCDSILRSP